MNESNGSARKPLPLVDHSNSNVSTNIFNVLEIEYFKLWTQ